MRECIIKNLGPMKKMAQSKKAELLNTLRITYTEIIPERCSVYELMDGYYLIFRSWKFLNRMQGKDWWVAISPTGEILGVTLENVRLIIALKCFHEFFMMGQEETGQFVISNEILDGTTYCSFSAELL